MFVPVSVVRQYNYIIREAYINSSSDFPVANTHTPRVCICVQWTRRGVNQFATTTKLHNIVVAWASTNEAKTHRRRRSTRAKGENGCRQPTRQTCPVGLHTSRKNWNTNDDKIVPVWVNVCVYTRICKANGTNERVLLLQSFYSPRIIRNPI
jgi:hypothetical protein